MNWQRSNSMGDYLVDVPVRVNIWIRPECQKAQFEVIKKAKPSVIFLQSDGGRNEKEWEAIYENRKLVEEGIDWNCTVYKLYEDHNNGLYAMGKKVSDFIWTKVDRCIFLEDDHIPSVSFFRFCADLLDKYKDDERIERICGMNHFGIWEQCDQDYFFAIQGAVWGSATWRRVALKRDCEFSYAQSSYTMRLLKQETKNNRSIWDRIVGYSKNNHYGGHVAGGEFFNELECYTQHRLSIIPKYNMIDCWGCGDDSIHSTAYKFLPRNMKKIFYMKTYEYEFPLKSNKFVLYDAEYDRKAMRLMQHGYKPWQKMLYSIVTLDINYLYGFLYRKVVVRQKKDKFEK